MIVYVVIGDLYYDGEYLEGVFSTIEEAKRRAESLRHYDEVNIHEKKLDAPEYEGDKWEV